MQNLLQFILRYSNFFTFLLLETICIYMLVTFNASQKEIYVYSSNLASGKVLNTMHNVKSYTNLSEVNDSLAAENALLRATLLTIQKDSINAPSLDSSTLYTLIAGEVINNNILSRHNMLTLDRGSKDGIEPSMGLIDDKGIVGIVKSVSPHYATAYSILNTSLRISAKIQRNNYFGTLIWEADDIRFMTLTSIPKHVEVRLGDTISTTEFSTIFPSNIPVGTVEEIDLPAGRNDFSIKVKLFNDLAQLNVVYAVKGRWWEERRKLENETEDE